MFRGAQQPGGIEAQVRVDRKLQRIFGEHLFFDVHELIAMFRRNPGEVGRG